MLRFKVKGRLHATSTVVPIAAIDAERASTLGEFVDKTCTVNRMRQGVQHLFGNEEPTDEWHRKSKAFCKWVVDDIFAEDAESLPNVPDGTEKSHVTKLVTAKAQEWFRLFIEMGDD